MRASYIREQIAQTLRNCELDQSVAGYDRLTWLDLPATPEAPRERSFRVVISAQPHRSPVNICSAFRCEYLIEVYYSVSSGVEGRIADDCERIFLALESCDLSADYFRLKAEPQGVEERDRNMVSLISVVTDYSLGVQ